jgi:hypothetical protein
MRLINLPAIGKAVTIGQYVTAIKLAKSNPHREFKHGLSCWWPCIGKEIMRQFRSGLQERINQAVPYFERGIN